MKEKKNKEIKNEALTETENGARENYDVQIF